MNWDLQPYPEGVLMDGSLTREAKAQSRQEQYSPQLPDGGAVPARCGHCLLPSAAHGTCTLAKKIATVTSL